MSGPTRPRILLIAEAANPDWASVPLIGWSLSEALGRVADVHLVTQIRNRDAIIARGWVEGRDFTTIDTERLARPMWKLAGLLRMGEGKGWTTLAAINALTYGYFERLIWKKFGAAIRAHEYDIVHRITPLTPSANSTLAPKCAKAGVPFVLGPLNGGVAWPKGFDAYRRREREWLSYLRDLYKLRPARGAMLRSCAAILCGSGSAMSEIPKAQSQKTIYLPENAIDTSRFNLRARQDGQLPIRCCFVGRLVPLKGVDMLIEAMAPLLNDRRAVLDIIGAGPEEEPLRALASQLGVASAVTFHGWLDHEQVQDTLARASLLTFPSIREFGGGVVLEAMALGVVPMVCDYGGPGELVDASVGFAIPMGSRQNIVQNLRAELEKICAHPEMLVDLSDAAIKRVNGYFTWTRKAEQISDVYDWVLKRRADRPDPFGKNP